MEGGEKNADQIQCPTTIRHMVVHSHHCHASKSNSESPDEKHTRKGAHIMTVRERARSGILADFSVLFQLAIKYRIPMLVKEAVVFKRRPENDVYYRCPRCQALLDREFIAHCSECGQCLNWDKYRKAKRIYHKATK
jgi:hypothetical protein